MNTPKSFTLPQPKLLCPTIICLICALSIFLVSLPGLFTSSNFISYAFQYLLPAFLFPFSIALGLFLLYRLLKTIILYHTFRPLYILTILAIILSACVFQNVFTILLYGGFYVVVAIISVIYLFFQKSHSLLSSPSHFYHSLLATSISSILLGLINLTAFLFLQEADLLDLAGVSVVFLYPLQLALTFSSITNFISVRVSDFLPRSNLVLLCLSFLLTIATVITYLVIFGTYVADDYIPPHQHASLDASLPISPQKLPS